MSRLMKTAMIVCMMLMSISLTNGAQAEERVGFSVEAELPDNQVDPSVTFYDLRVERDQEQALTLTIYNHENEALTVNGEVLNASTNSNGLIVYEAAEVDESLTEPVDELVELSGDEWTIPAGESRTIEAKVDMDDTAFDGIKLGGLHFQKAESEADDAEGVSIQNKYAYVIGVRLSQNDETVDPELELASVVPGLINYRTAVTANIRNTQPVIMSDVSITADVFHEEETSPLRTVEQEDIRMAPNSVMPFNINWENEPLEAGEYRLEMTATDGENEWQWNENFQISAEDESINEEAVELEDEQSINYWFIAGIAVLLIIIAGLIFYIRRLKKQSEK